MQVLRGEDSGAELADEEDDDEDFVLDWDELLGTAVSRAGDGAGAACCLAPRPLLCLPWGRLTRQCGLAEGHAQPVAPRRSKRRRNYVYQPKLDRAGYQERPLQSTLLLQTRYAAGDAL